MVSKKGKRYEELYGVVRAKEIKEKLRKEWTDFFQKRMEVIDFGVHHSF